MPTYAWPLRACAKCCINMACGGVPPTELTAVADVTGSCPEAANNVLSVTVVNVPPSCEDYCAGSPTLCDCIFSWIIDDADRPTCVPYMDHIFVQCRDDNGLPLAEGCDHVRHHHGIIYAEIGVTATDILLPRPAPCPIDAETGLAQHPVQSCEDCTWGCAPGLGDPECCATCPPCYNCPSHNAQRCALGLQCCGTGGCPTAEPCPEPGFRPCEGPCYPCSHVWVTPEGSPIVQSCAGCSLSYSQRRYVFWASACSASTTVEGCNPTACPPDPLNYGDFYLNFNCTDDSLTFHCPTGEMLRLRRKLPPNRALIAEMVRRMPAERVAELLKRLEK